MKLPLVFNSQTFTVSPRIALIVKQLLEQRADVEAVPFGSWQVHFAGRRMQTLLTKSYRTQTAETDEL